MTPQTFFERHEKKYLLSQGQYEALRELLQGQAQQDDYGLHTICTLYYDTDDNRSIRQREDKLAYREKLRLRSYGVPGNADTVFLELKKKVCGVTYKRRLPLPLAEARAYLQHGQPPTEQGQVFGEIDWFMKQNCPKAQMLICYDRIALTGLEDPQLRITFDSGIRFRDEALDLAGGDWGEHLLGRGERLMEIKTPGAIPLWLAGALSQVEAYTLSFSKYNNVYEALCRHSVADERLRAAAMVQVEGVMQHAG